MDEPRQRFGRPALIAAGVFLLLLIAGIFVQTQHPAPKLPTSAAPAGEAEIAPEAAVTLPPIGRTGLIDAAADAADAYAMGRPPPDTNDILVGRRIDLRLPFGCFGPAPESAAALLSWQYDAKTEALRVTAQPEIWTEQPWIKALAPAAEAVEGFWIARPWLRSGNCPVSRPFTAPPFLALPRETLGVAELFQPGSSRVGHQIDRPYRAIVKMAPEDFPKKNGFFLVLKGRVATFPTGQPIACWSDSPVLQPICLVAADIDSVALETPDGTRLGEWES